jgi:hypothetical protein
VISVDNLAAFVNGQAAIRITVVGNSGIGTMLEHGGY